MKFLRLIHLLFKLRFAKSNATNQKKICHSIEQIAPDISVAIYKNIKKEKSIWLLLHGLTVHGNQDPRLVDFARSLASSGITCLLPTLTGLSSCRLLGSDVERVAQVVDYAYRRYQRPVGVIGFSFGASYALVAASRKDLADHVRGIIGFGAYHQIEDLWAEYKKRSSQTPADDREWDAWIYRRLVLVKGYGQPLLASAELNELDVLLNRYCGQASLAEKKEFYQRCIHKLNWQQFLDSACNREEWQKISPTAGLENLKCPVTLIHDRYDPVIPPIHSEKLYADFQQRSQGKKNRLVLTSLLSHVSPGQLLNVKEIFEFSSAMAVLFD
ncbi:MAG: alpha/beta hydrolase [Candidatus Aminicenantes bacterium]|nr:alpha/beta hydrolase [Candidatus Aminicenantes bacterium]